MKMDENRFLVSSVEYDSASVRPIICNFQNGTIPEGFEEHMTSQVYRDADNDLVVAVAANKQLYTKKVTANKTHNTFIAIPNSKRTKVRLIAVDYAKLAPHLEDDDAPSTTEINLNTTMEFRDKKAKRFISERAKLKQNVESIHDHLRETVAGISVNEGELNASISDSSYRPTIDIEAESVEEVYSLHDIVSKRVLDSLTKEVQRIFNCESEEEWGTCGFVTAMLNNFDDIDSKENLTACQIWLYADCLIKFLTTTAKVITTKRFRACYYSDLADHEIIQNFTVSGSSGRTRPTIMKDKCTCYLLVLCILNSKYSMDVSELCHEGFVSSKRMLEFARVLRFVVKGNTVTLQLPLPNVVQKMVKMGKRK